VRETAVVIGAGIVGLATARALAVRGHPVIVLERYQRAVGASIRNFGSVWPIGVPNGHLYERALRSRRIWLNLLQDMRIWHAACGSLHVARAADEMQALEAYAELNRGVRSCRVLDASAAREVVPALRAQGLCGGMFSADEVLFDPREALGTLPKYLEERHGVRFRWGVAAHLVESGRVHCGREQLAADRIYVCGGADFEWLCPEVFAAAAITRCKLQMMRLAPPSGGLRLAAALASGLSLVHYAGFRLVPEVAAVRARLERERADLLELGIHLLVMQNGRGEIAVGDSHAYADTPDPFDDHTINEKLLECMRQMLELPRPRVAQSWHGVYAKLTDGGTELVREASPGVTVVNGLGGLGMTLAFGLAEELLEGHYRPVVPAS